MWIFPPALADGFSLVRSGSFLGSFGSGWYFLWSAIPICLFLLSLSSFRWPVCRGWKWIFKTSIHVCHHDQAFSNWVFFLSVALCESRYIFASGPYSSPSNSFPMLLCIRLFRYVLFVPIFCIKIVLLPCRPVVGISSCILPLLAGWIFYRCFGMSCFVYIVWSYLDIFLAFFLSPEPSNLFPRVVLFVLFVFLVSFRLNKFLLVIVDLSSVFLV